MLVSKVRQEKKTLKNQKKYLNYARKMDWNIK